MSRGRAEAFSDGVFAVAITVLIFNVHVDGAAKGGLASQVLHAWPSYAAYVASFLTIGVMWINHHRLFMMVAKVDRPLLLLNLLLLMMIVFVPFPTSLVAQNIQGGGARTAALVYSVTATIIAIAFAAVWVYIVSRDGILGEHIDRSAARTFNPRFAAGTFGYAASILVALVSPIAVLILYVVIAVYYAFEQLPTGERSTSTT